MRTSLEYVEMLCKIKGYDLCTILKYQSCYRTLDDPKSMIQYELMKADLQIRCSTYDTITAVNEIFNRFGQAIAEAAKVLSMAMQNSGVLELFRDIEKTIDNYEKTCNNKRNNLPKCNIKSVNLEQYMKQHTFTDQREVIQRNVRNHRY